MVNFTIEQVRKIMDNPRNIRNISVIAHVDHGKSTLTDSLIAKAGLINQNDAGDKRFTDGRKDEKERGITIKSTGVTLYYELEQPYLINLIDSPGHVDFSAEVTAALRVTDGALVVVDAVEGVCVQTETVLRQACQERIRSVLMINKMDRVILEMKLEGEEIYQRITKTICQVNEILGLYDGGNIDPTNGSVAFGAGKDCWAFTLKDFAKPLSEKLKLPIEVMLKKLWGEYYFNPDTKKIQTESQNLLGQQLQRTFVYFVINPIIKICNNIMENNQEEIEQFLIKHKIELNQLQKKLEKKELLKVVMSKWINAADSLLEMIVTHLPSPVEAQVYRTEYLYEGNMDDEAAIAMKNCDPKGPLMMFVSKFIPSTEKGHFYAFGRIFSGTLSQGQHIRILGSNYIPGKQEHLFEKKANTLKIMMGSKAETIADVPCGNTVAITGIDGFLLKTATITNHPTANKIRSMKFSVSPVVRIAVSVQKAADLPKLIEGMRRLSATDNLVVCSTEDNGQNVIACCGDLHAEICLNDLREYAQVPLVASDPVVTYRETITQETQVCMTKSANKLNRLYAQAKPLQSELTDQIEKGNFVNLEPKDRAKELMEYDWEKQDALRIWCFGPENSGANILTELTTGIQNLEQIHMQMDHAFQWATKQGALIEEPLRGVRVNLVDCKVHADPVHSGGGQILQAARRLYYACELGGKPRLQEPVFLTEIASPQQMAGQIYQCLNKRRGIIIEENLIPGSTLIQVKGYLPVSESFGFAGALREMTQGQAFPQCSFDHWEIINGDPLEQGSKAYNIVMDNRKRKGLKLELPKFDDFNDKL